MISILKRISLSRFHLKKKRILHFRYLEGILSFPDIDFRMGYTKDSFLGKFVIYPEKHKRSPAKYQKPMKIKGKH